MSPTKPKIPSRVTPKRGKPKPRRRRAPRQRGVGPSSLVLDAPQRMSTFSSGFRFKAGSVPDSIVICGRDLAATALRSTDIGGAPIVTTIPLGMITNPLVTRWGTFATLFQRYRIRRLVARFVATQPTTIVGTNAIAFTQAYATAAPTDIKSCVAINKSVLGNAYSALTCNFEPDTQLKWYDTADGGSHDSGDTVGVFYHVSDSFSSTVVPGRIEFDYEVEFAAPH
jgi:hypothetical protein